MIMKNHYDVLVIGAGPAGSIAAMCLAREGHEVLLLDKNDFPRDKSCGDGLTRTSTKLLYELGIWHRFEGFQKIQGIKVFLEGEGYRQFDYPDYLSHPGYGLVVPRVKLDAILWEEAVNSGASFMGRQSFKELLFANDGKIIGVELISGDRYYAELVIGADGSASKIAYQAELTSTPKNQLGFGIRGYYTNVHGLNQRLELFLPILDKSKKRILPSYGWVFPLDNNTVNIGVGLIEKTDEDNIRSVMDKFVEQLKGTDPRFEYMELVGKHFGAPMRFDFSPEHTYKPGLLLVGDAAGMISPFTGEGIGYAIETARIAAAIYSGIKKGDNPNFRDLSAYGKQLANKYQGYFETGTNSVNRYHLVWKVLKSTFQNDQPLFNTVRQATVFPEGIGESFFEQHTENVAESIVKYRALLRTDLVTIADNIINITRKDWPFLSRLFTATQVTPGIPFRPSLFLLLAGYNGTNDNRDLLVTLGSALELGFAATICHDSVLQESAEKSDVGVNWGNMIAILVGDFLLAKSFELVASCETKYTQLISEAVANSNEGIVRLRNRLITGDKSCTIAEYLELCYRRQSYAFELCIHLGAIARSAEASERTALRQFGKYFGASYFIVEDTLNHRANRSNKFNVTVANPLYLRDEQMSLMQLLLQNKKNGMGKVAYESECEQECFSIALGEMKKGLAELCGIADPSRRESLFNLAQLVIQKSTQKDLV